LGRRVLGTVFFAANGKNLAEPSIRVII